MEMVFGALPWITGGLLAAAALTFFRQPLEWLLGLFLRTGAGLALLWVLGSAGGLLGIRLGVNLANALVLGLLGAPGFGLLLMMNWVLAL